MSMHRSLKGASKVAARRNVLKRFERIEVMKAAGKWKEGDRGRGLPAALAFEVGIIALDASDRDRLVHVLERFAERAGRLALHLLRTDAAAHGRQQAVLADDGHRRVEAAFRRRLQKIRDADAHRAALHARRVLALQAALGLHPRLLGRVAERDLAHVAAPDGGILRRHRLRRDRQARFWGQGLGVKLP